jgi:hypothetical protein
MQTFAISKALTISLIAISGHLVMAQAIEKVQLSVSASGKTIKVVAELEDYPSQIQVRGRGANGIKRMPILGAPVGEDKFIGFLATPATADKLCKLMNYASGQVDTIGTEMDVPIVSVSKLSWWNLKRDHGIQYNTASEAFEVVPHTQGGYLSIAECCRTSPCPYN